MEGEERKEGRDRWMDLEDARFEVWERGGVEEEGRRRRKSSGSKRVRGEEERVNRGSRGEAGEWIRREL